MDKRISVYFGVFCFEFVFFFEKIVLFFSFVLLFVFCFKFFSVFLSCGGISRVWGTRVGLGISWGFICLRVLSSFCFLVLKAFVSLSCFFMFFKVYRVDVAFLLLLKTRFLPFKKEDLAY